MAFNRSLWRATAAQIGLEGRALQNVAQAWSTYWAPVVNLARSPRWVSELVLHLPFVSWLIYDSLRPPGA